MVVNWIRAQPYPTCARDASVHFGLPREVVVEILRRESERGKEARLSRSFVNGVELFDRLPPTIAQRIVRVLGEHAPVSRGQLASRLGVPSHSMSFALNGLKKDGQVVVDESEEGRWYRLVGQEVARAPRSEEHRVRTIKATSTQMPQGIASSVFAWRGAQ